MGGEQLYNLAYLAYHLEKEVGHGILTNGERVAGGQARLRIPEMEG